MVHEVSKNLKSRSAGEAISFFHCTPRLSATGVFVTAHYWALSWDFTSHLSKSHYNFILLYMPRSPKWGLPLRLTRSFFFRVYQLPITKFIAHIIFFEFIYYARLWVCIWANITIPPIHLFLIISCMKKKMYSNAWHKIAHEKFVHDKVSNPKQNSKIIYKTAIDFPCIWHVIHVSFVDEVMVSWLCPVYPLNISHFPSPVIIHGLS